MATAAHPEPAAALPARVPVLLAAAALTPVALGVVDRAVRLPAPCPLRAATGLPCPLCGASRAFTALAHGDVGGALAYHLPVVLLAFAAVLLAAALLVAPARTAPPARTLAAAAAGRAPLVLLGMGAVFWAWTLSHRGLIAP